MSSLPPSCATCSGQALMAEVTSSEVVPAARMSDVRHHLHARSPRWIQFSGHGRPSSQATPLSASSGSSATKDDGWATGGNFTGPLVFENDLAATAGQQPTLEGQDFVALLEHCHRLEGVFLNACHTQGFAEHINSQLPSVAVIGWPAAVTDNEAYKFAEVRSRGE